MGGNLYSRWASRYPGRVEAAHDPPITTIPACLFDPPLPLCTSDPRKPETVQCRKLLWSITDIGRAMARSLHLHPRSWFGPVIFPLEWGRKE
jgi:hypothetical protein